MKKVLLIILLSGSTMAISHEGEYEGRYVLQPILNNTSEATAGAPLSIFSATWVLDTVTGILQACNFKEDKGDPIILCSDWSKK
jgi:hypothetical protein